jgi:hypothetical protein
LLEDPKLGEDPKPLERFQDELPGSEYDGNDLLTPPFHEQVPRPEFELKLPLLHTLPADAGATDTRELARIPMIAIASSLFFTLFSCHLGPQ